MEWIEEREAREAAEIEKWKEEAPARQAIAHQYAKDLAESELADWIVARCMVLGGHSNPAIRGQLKTGQRSN